MISIIQSGRFEGWTPLDLSPALWLDASDEATIISSGGAVSLWADKSGNARHTSQNLAARKPTTGSATIGGLNALSFDGGDSLHASAAQFVAASDGAVTALAVVQFTNTAGIVSVVDCDDEIVPRHSQMLRRNGTAIEAVRVHGGVVVDASGVTITSAVPYVLTSRQAAATLETWVNGVSHGSSALSGASATDTQALSVGSHNAFGGSAFLVGSIGEIIVYPSALSPSDRSAAEVYLSSKWAVY